MQSPRLRGPVSYVAFVAMVLIVLNVETLAQQFGWDKLLTRAIEHGPTWLASIVSFLTSDSLFWVCVAIVAYAAGLWTERLIAKARAALQPHPIDVPGLASDLREIAEVTKAIAPALDLKSKFLKTYLVDDIGLRFRHWDSGIDIGPSPKTTQQALMRAEMLERIAVALDCGDLEAARSISSEYLELPQHQGDQVTPTTRP